MMICFIAGCFTDDHMLVMLVVLHNAYREDQRAKEAELIMKVSFIQSLSEADGSGCVE